MPSQRYYAVAQGRPPAPGIFLSWDVTKSLVNGYKGSLFRGFSTLEGATNYLAEKNVPEDQRVIRSASVDELQA
ncbi:hypothetical protein BDV37DRAFT_246185 [Aspergillus pseudonomiae]|uniref:Ribonuclease H1 N-terminal domain-containing protein n=1 Tax=Aspergillus pseudonomiae TaxID=1506151 RepID=A0A5N7DH20_9EURO|nr:uncharacterized protein BDV37DRAFT_246185 [Aspergillus pseudonomiae]KAE8404958.1 hypothetical protein BDV37DRAFT_246185 [Aspergillus pseudonomiae]